MTLSRPGHWSRGQARTLMGRNVIVVSCLIDECVHCREQLVSMSSHAGDWATQRTLLLAASRVSPEKNKSSDELGKLGFRLLSDPDHANARCFASYDDCEEFELHSTILIDAKGRVHWNRTVGDPFVDVDFLLKTVRRMNAGPAAPR